jgi:phosphohistidine phosphatase
MDLFLLRHADALDRAPTDMERPLSEKGHTQAASVARFIAKAPLKPALILSSPAIRTMETAGAVARALKLEILSCDWAQPGMHPDDAIQELKAYRNTGPVLLVGHQPDLSLLASRLLSFHYPERLPVSKASLMHLQLFSADSAELVSFVPCKLM